MSITTIRVVTRANVFVAKGRMNKSMFVGYMGLGHELKLYELTVCMLWAELTEVVGRIGPRA